MMFTDIFYIIPLTIRYFLYIISHTADQRALETVNWIETLSHNQVQSNLILYKVM